MSCDPRGFRLTPRIGSLDSLRLWIEEIMKRLELPEAPANQTGPVKAWSEPVVIPTYRPMPPDKNPMFFEKRVYQRSSGRVYPLPFTHRIATEAVEHSWQALHLENVFIRLMVPPEIGGRIHVGVDKCNAYDRKRSRDAPVSVRSSGEDASPSCLGNLERDFAVPCIPLRPAAYSNKVASIRMSYGGRTSKSDSDNRRLKSVSCLVSTRF
jgi:hypothetical protein